MKSSDYNKVRGVIVENCNKVSLHSKVTITKLYWTALEIPTYHVTYTYSDKTNDDQKVVLEKIRLFMKKDQVTLMAMFQNIRNRFWSRNLSKRLRRKLKKQLKKQKLGLPISSFSFLSNFSYYQISYQTLIDKELIEMVIYIDEKITVKSQDMKDAAKKLDASDLPNGEYNFFYSNTKDENQD